MIVKTLQPTKELEQIFDLILKGNSSLVFDYGDSFIEMKSKPKKPKSNKKTSKQNFINYFKNKKPLKLNNAIFNEQNSAQEKANFRNLRYNLND
jgi:hypothetical protein